MRKIFPICLLSLLFVSAVQAQTLVWKDSYRNALKAAQAEKKEILVYLNGSDWCPQCRDYKSNVIDSKEFATKFAKRFIAFEDDHPDWPDEATKKRLIEKRRDFGYHIRNYPGVVLLDSDNRRFFVKDGTRGDAAELIAEIEKAYELKTKRDTLLEAAAKSEGLDKAKHLAAVLELLGKQSIHGGNSHRRLFDELKKLDPEDTTGAVRRLDYNVDSFAERTLWPLLREKKYDEALAAVEKEFNDPRNDMELKQRFTAMKFHVYQSQAEKLDKALETLNELIALDDSTYMAELARGYIKNITEPIILEKPAWSGQNLRFFFATWHLDARTLIDSPGKYEIRMERTRAEDIEVRDVSFAVDGKETVKAEMPRDKKVVLEVSNFDLDKPRELRFSVKGHGWFGSQGVIHVKKI